MSDKLTVEVYPDAEAIGGEEATVFNGIDFVSFVNEGTFGPPALVAPSPKEPGRPPLARPGQKVLYINTSLVPLFSIERAD
jgi:hypothetical protein